MTAPFAPGDRVLVEAVVAAVDNFDHLPESRFILKVANGDVVTSLADKMHPLPTRASKLRAAAEVIFSGAYDVLFPELNNTKPMIEMTSGLIALAEALEASAAPKAPTLREAVKDLLDAMPDARSLAEIREAYDREGGAP